MVSIKQCNMPQISFTWVYLMEHYKLPTNQNYYLLNVWGLDFLKSFYLYVKTSISEFNFWTSICYIQKWQKFMTSEFILFKSISKHIYFFQRFLCKPSFLVSTTANFTFLKTFFFKNFFSEQSAYIVSELKSK